MECSKCGRGYGKFSDVITGEGIVKLCSSCLNSEDAFVVKKPTEDQIQGENKDTSLYNRLSRNRGIDPQEHKKNIFGSVHKEKLKEQEVNLRDLIDKKFDSFVKEKKLQKREDLVDNFHWILMRARRNKKMSVIELAKEIGESEKIIKMAEQGVLPEGDIRIVQKLETILGINLFKPEVAEMINEKRRQLGFDEFSSRELTISDLQEMKKDVPKELVVKKEPYWRRVMSKIFNSEEKEVDFEETVPGEGEGKINTHSDLHTGVDEKRMGESLEFDILDDLPVEFGDTSLEITGEVFKKEEIEEESREEKASQERDLTREEIDDLIFGRK